MHTTSSFWRSEATSPGDGEIVAFRKIFSPWASAVVLVRKMDGELRFCIDLHKLNNRTITDGYALPTIRDLLDCLQGTICFLIWIFQQVELEEKQNLCFYSRAFRILGVSKDAFWAHHCTSYMPEVDGILPWWIRFDLIYQLSRWHHCLLSNSQKNTLPDSMLYLIHWWQLVWNWSLPSMN